MTDPRNPGIYCIRNTVNDKCYVGSATQIAARWKNHRTLLARNLHHSRPLQNAWNKYGAGAFVFIVLELVTVTDLVSREQHWLDTFRPYAPTDGYNVLRFAYSARGYVQTVEARKKMSLWRKGRKKSEAHRLQLIANLKAWQASNPKRAPLTEQHKASLRIAHTGRIMSAEWRANMSTSAKTKKITPEFREKMRAYHTGRKRSPEQVLAMTLAQRARRQLEKETGKTLSDEARARMSAGQKRRQAAARFMAQPADR